MMIRRKLTLSESIFMPRRCFNVSSQWSQFQFQCTMNLAIMKLKFMFEIIINHYAVARVKRVNLCNLLRVQFLGMKNAMELDFSVESEEKLSIRQSYILSNLKLHNFNVFLFFHSLVFFYNEAN